MWYVLLVSFIYNVYSVSEILMFLAGIFMGIFIYRRFLLSKNNIKTSWKTFFENYLLPRGRISGEDFFWRVIILIGLGIATVGIIVFGLGMAFLDFLNGNIDVELYGIFIFNILKVITNYVLAFFFWVIPIVSLRSLYILYHKRLQDMNIPGWYGLLVVVNFICWFGFNTPIPWYVYGGLFVLSFIVLCFRKGMNGDNTYGKKLQEKVLPEKVIKNKSRFATVIERIGTIVIIVAVFLLIASIIKISLG